jgi:hypothetical protein
VAFVLLSFKFSPEVQPFCKCRHLFVSTTFMRIVLETGSGGMAVIRHRVKVACQF